MIRCTSCGVIYRKGESGLMFMHQLADHSANVPGDRPRTPGNCPKCNVQLGEWGNSTSTHLLCHSVVVEEWNPSTPHHHGVAKNPRVSGGGNAGGNGRAWCTPCHRKFPSVLALRDHQAAKHTRGARQKVLTCRECQAAFCDSGRARSHLRQNHKVSSDGDGAYRSYFTEGHAPENFRGMVLCEEPGCGFPSFQVEAHCLHEASFRRPCGARSGAAVAGGASRASARGARSYAEVADPAQQVGEKKPVETPQVVSGLSELSLAQHQSISGAGDGTAQADQIRLLVRQEVGNFLQIHLEEMVKNLLPKDPPMEQE